MKTLRKDGQIKRVADSSPTEDSEIKSMINDGWNYISKSEWKSTRPAKKEKIKKEKKK